MKSQIKVALVLLAAGSGSRFGQSTNKVWLDLNGQSVITRSIKNATAGFESARLILVINPDDQDIADELLSLQLPHLKIEVVYGGATRHESEYNALKHLAPAIESGEIKVVVIHDGARPLATTTLFLEIATAAEQFGGAIPTIVVTQPEMDTQKDEQVVRVQTPQGYLAKELLQAYIKAAEDKFIGTDTAACMERYFPNIITKAIVGDPLNLKITYPQDLAIATEILN